MKETQRKLLEDQFFLRRDFTIGKPIFINIFSPFPFYEIIKESKNQILGRNQRIIQ